MGLALWLATTALAGSGTTLLRVDDVEGVPVARVRALGGEVVRCFASSRVCLVEGSVSLQALAALPGVRSAEPDGPLTLAAGTVDATADCPEPWGLLAMEIEGAWAEGTCGLDAPVVAVQDSGFRTTHLDLLDRIVGGYDYGDGDPLPEVSWASGVPEHGTFIAGIVGAVADDRGRTGVAPDGGLFLQKVADSSGALLFSYAIAAMDDLASSHPEVGVLNYSIASSTAPMAFRDAVAALEAADILVVAAAANCPVPQCADADNDAYPVYPASYALPHVVAVASARPDGSLDPQSHYGATSVDLAAPGAQVCSLDVVSDTATTVASGTSYAAPMVAGVAALVRESWPRLDAPEVAEVLRTSCSPQAALVGRVACGGTVDADAAVHTPVVVLEPPADVVVEGTGILSLEVDSRAAAGELVVVLTHPASVRVDLETAVPFAAGELLALPSGDEIAGGDGTLVVLDLPADVAVTLEVPLVAVADGTGEAAVRAIATGGADAGWATPTVDAAGPDAVWTLTVDAVLPVTEPTTTPGTTPTTTVTPLQEGPDAAEPAGEAAAGCGCRTGAAGAGWVWALVLAAGRRRRHSA